MNETENKGRLFTIKTLKAVIIKGLFEVIKPYIKETNIMITPEYIKISTLDMTSIFHPYQLFTHRSINHANIIQVI